ncbi:Hypothetical protein POVR1_LOCUS226 [uncultured virus]|nr:Hypothetical protein POVR1_LOCUS226 [uncultured virus]
MKSIDDRSKFSQALWIMKMDQCLLSSNKYFYLSSESISLACLVATPRFLVESDFADYSRKLTRLKPLMIFISNINSLASTQNFALSLAAQVQCHVLIYETSQETVRNRSRSRSESSSPRKVLKTSNESKGSPRIVVSDAPRKDTQSGDSKELLESEIIRRRANSSDIEMTRQRTNSSENDIVRRNSTPKKRVDDNKQHSKIANDGSAPKMMIDDGSSKAFHRSVIHKKPLDDPADSGSSEILRHRSSSSSESSPRPTFSKDPSQAAIEMVLSHLLVVSKIDPENLILFGMDSGAGPATHGAKYLWEKTGKSINGCILYNPKPHSSISVTGNVNYCKSNQLVISQNINQCDYGAKLYEAIECDKLGYFSAQVGEIFQMEAGNYIKKLINKKELTVPGWFYITEAQGTPTTMNETKHHECEIL